MRRAMLFALLPAVALAVGGDQLRPLPSNAAQAFLSSLDREQHRQTVLPFEDDYRTLWRYTPQTRRGIAWSAMTPEQSQRAHDLIKATLSDMGYHRTQAVRTIEQVLSGIENSTRRDKDNYVFTFFGAPSEKAKWGWRYEGHHISLNFTYEGNRLVSSTPQFFGSNPAEVPSGEHKGTRILAKEEDLAIQFLASLTNEQKKTAVLADRAPSEIFTAENRTATKQEGGIAFSALNQEQQRSLQELVRMNAMVQDPVEVKRRMDAIEKSGWDTVVFAWMGAPDRSAAHYFRVQGPTFLIEFDNSQNRANHIHLVWRDFEGDFGRDVLKEHYELHRHDPVHGHDH
jgi:hypothetical protein